ncbi:MAG: response regulator [Gemmatimonadales bacterium]
MARIVLAEDEAALRNNLARYLKTLGHDVRTAGNGNEAMTELGAGPTDVLITDINMPDMDGIEILNTLRKQGSTLPVIAISGGGQFSKQLLLSSATMLGALLTLEKPFALDDLRVALERVLSAP